MAGLHTYTVVGICDPEAFPKVEEFYESIFTLVDVMFFAGDNTTKTSSNFFKNVLA